MEERRVNPQSNGQVYDPAKILTAAALLFVFILILFVAAIIGVQILKSGEANTESWAALTGLIGWATSQVSVLYSNRYGTTQQSVAKDMVIAQQARTASAVAAVTTALAPPPPAAVDSPPAVNTSPTTTGV